MIAAQINIVLYRPQHETKRQVHVQRRQCISKYLQPAVDGIGGCITEGCDKLTVCGFTRQSPTAIPAL